MEGLQENFATYRNHVVMIRMRKLLLGQSSSYCNK